MVPAQPARSTVDGRVRRIRRIDVRNAARVTVRVIARPHGIVVGHGSREDIRAGRTMPYSAGLPPTDLEILPRGRKSVQIP